MACLAGPTGASASTSDKLAADRARMTQESGRRRISSVDCFSTMVRSLAFSQMTLA